MRHSGEIVFGLALTLAACGPKGEQDDIPTESVDPYSLEAGQVVCAYLEQYTGSAESSYRQQELVIHRPLHEITPENAGVYEYDGSLQVGDRMFEAEDADPVIPIPDIDAYPARLFWPELGAPDAPDEGQNYLVNGPCE
ncbi:MAG TPA: hypothetical protein VK674_01050 [Candidatus Limnocylindria bacterium]|nr:hypothetical protein [Candidatus Limnocylindria bacterium]